MPVQPSPSLPATTRPHHGRDLAAHAIAEEQQHLDATITQHLCEEVMVPLSLVHPGQSVEEEAVGIARGEPAQFVTRSVQ